MGLKKLRPITPGQRYRLAPDFSEITKSTPEKSLLVKYSKSGGRNSQGRMTNLNRGGGHKKRGRLVDFARTKHNVPAKVKGIEYDPTRSARIALLYYADGEKSYIIAPEDIKVGAEVKSGPEVAPEIGNHLPLSNMPLGTIIHNIELKPGKGGQLVRGAGNYGQLLAREGKYATVKLPSGERRLILSKCYATIGSVSNPDHMNVVLGKAGRARWLGKRPRTRAVAMNPVDHPMGGGEGKASGGHPRNRRGLKAKGAKTRRVHKYSDNMIINRRNRK